MAEQITNFIQFDADNHDESQGKGRISTITKDLPIEVEPFTSDNPKAPVLRVYSRSPAGHRIEIGGIWRRDRADGSGTHLTLTVPGLALRANLGRMAGQDDPNLMAIIPWSGTPL